ncbi:MAG TPA: sensor histidine kinase, partial [Sphingobacteriaceae bacterium]
VLILEGQEEERKRLAMDIHDGIGQMLTSLKFQIESLDLNKRSEESRAKLVEIQQLITQVIKEVRRVTFNLKPTVLGDYGLQAALNVFVKEIAKLSDIELTYHSDAEGTLRLPQKIENNVFRIIQEAINNAIKYSEASRIDVTLQQTDNFIVIVVKDNGKGFDEKLVEKRSVNIESGRGFFNMYERTEYINGSLDVKSEPGNGTTITLTVPVKTLITADQ